MGERFDHTLRKCVDTRKVQCFHTSQKPLLHSSPTNGGVANEQSILENINMHISVCHNKLDGLYPDVAKDCRVYHECRSGEKQGNYVCDKDMSFDIYKGICLPNMYSVCVRSGGDLRVAADNMSTGNTWMGVNMWHRLVTKRQIKFNGLSPGLLKAMGHILEQLGENMEIDQ
jgi:hypothetical protein